MEEYRQWCLEEIAQWSMVMRQSDVLEEFWAVVELLVNEREAAEGVEFKWEETAETLMSDGRSGKLEIPKDCTELLFIRPKLLHQKYQISCKRQGIDPLNITTLMEYIKKRDYYLGLHYKQKFTTKGEASTTTSAVVIDWKMLREMNDISLGYADKEPAAAGVDDGQDDLPF
jgi:hypothetical protein